MDCAVELAEAFRELGTDESGGYIRGLRDAWTALYDAGIVTKTNYR